MGTRITPVSRLFAQTTIFFHRTAVFERCVVNMLVYCMLSPSWSLAQTSFRWKKQSMKCIWMHFVRLLCDHYSSACHFINIAAVVDVVGRPETHQFMMSARWRRMQPASLMFLFIYDSRWLWACMCINIFSSSKYDGQRSPFIILLQTKSTYIAY